MKKYLKKNNSENKGLAPYRKRKSSSAGFVILFALTLSSILLAIALGIANIAFQEINFGTGAKDANNAFFAADTGAECALFNDKSGGHSFVDPLVDPLSTGSVQCLGDTIGLDGSYPSWSFVVPRLGSAGQSCAIIIINKISLPNSTTIISKGYSGDSTCTSTNPNRTERELELNY